MDAVAGADDGGGDGQAESTDRTRVQDVDVSPGGLPGWATICTADVRGYLWATQHCSIIVVVSPIRESLLTCTSMCLSLVCPCRESRCSWEPNHISKKVANL
jgi:hypothetical protein